MAKIVIVGTGYVGLVTGACLAEMGHDIICSDVSKEKINMLDAGDIPIYEIGLKEIVHKNVAEGRLRFTTDVAGAIRECDAVFSAVGTPPDENHRADLKHVKEVAKTFAQNLNGYKVFVNKSTVPVGTGDIVKELIEKESGKSAPEDFDVVSNPEFLREGAAVKDFLNPDRIIMGCASQRACDIMTRIYKPLVRAQSPMVHTDVKSADLIKYASNAFLATKITFINEIANFCDKVGGNVKQVSKGMGLDNRIGPKFLASGIGFGGSCFPKDVDALYEAGIDAGTEFKILGAVKEVNAKQKVKPVEILKNKFGKNLKGKKVALWGLSFKPRTDDVREAPAYYIAKALSDLGVVLSAYDPVAGDNFKEWYKELDIVYHKNKYDAAKDCDAMILVTEWDEFRIVDFKNLQDHMKGNLIVDGRNLYSKEDTFDFGFELIGIGTNN